MVHMRQHLAKGEAGLVFIACAARRSRRHVSGAGRQRHNTYPVRRLASSPIKRAITSATVSPSRRKNSSITSTTSSLTSIGFTACLL